MVKPDTILSWPYHIDYPLFRYNLNRWRDYFDKVFISFTQQTMPEPHFADFLQNTMKNVRFIHAPNKYPDWRNNAIRDVLDNFCTSDYVLFLEQDFLIRDGNKFFDTVGTALFNYDFVIYKEGERIHPSFSLVKRSLIEQTKKDFSVHPTIDHFGFFFQELMPLGKSIELRELGLIDKEDFYHLAGVTHNYYNFLHDQPLYKEKEWLAYNYLSKDVLIKQSPQWLGMLLAIENVYGKGDYEGFISNFFPKAAQKGE
jgi:hypothetical protein